MVGELGQVRLGVARVQPLESLADLAVQLDSAGRTELVVEDIPDEGMREPQPTSGGRGGWHLADCTGGDRLVERLE